MANGSPNRAPGSKRLRSPLAMAVMLYSIFIAIYLTVGGILHFVLPPNVAAAAFLRAAAEASDGATVPASAGCADDSTSAKEDNRAYSD